MRAALTMNDACYRRGTFPCRELVPRASHRPCQALPSTHIQRGDFRCNYQNARHGDGVVLPLTESVERLVVEPVIRTAPWDSERLRQQEHKPQACLLLISESDVCRSVLAAASLRALLQEAGLAGLVEVATCGTRPYNLGEEPEPAAVAAAEALGLEPPAGHAARLFDPAVDIVSYDLLLVMDKYTAGDVMREVSSFDLINRTTQFSYKVRRLGEFIADPVADGSAPQYGSEGDEVDIEDPLYGNLGGDEEERAVLRAARTIRESCRGLVAFLQELQLQEQSGAAAESSTAESAPPPAAAALGPALRSRVRTMGPTSWLVPPMLSGRVDPEALPSF
ncbi:hypothetical protein PLESTB_001169400 [Pleodorina starrii]|uniref:protein-tyrosine-phosphatase n=1 Tax=Pleodorina starrii TaxID=330485 RepID=A0A9W6BRE2_9CHLO|nr:hypothetical protein PLESTM_000245200 [Pleodorina starrii]GLC56974.1 hypothetical protein PLESTB_001169400 [Pleodorina starrii]GLC64808.1 hypothetical protein PLESTF_000209700 [Pleodorina starrii]